MVNQALTHGATIESGIKDVLVVEKECVQFTYPPLNKNAYDQFKEVNELVTLFHEVMHCIFKHFPVYHLYSAAIKLESHHILRRKGSYFNHPVNGFV